MPFSAGMRLGPYEIVGSLGAGGMGEVYRARDTRLGRDVAVKVLTGDHVSRFEREARAAGGLNHPNVVGLLDAGTHENTRFLVSELLEGQTLREKLRAGPLPLGKALDLAIQTLQGLAAAHEKGVVHRDLKPENLFVTREGTLKILDFGLAKLPPMAGWQVSSATQPGTLLGSVGYMSPEQASGGEADHRSDVFAFGAVLYEMLSGRRAFEGDSAISVLNAILSKDPLDLTAANANVPPDLARVVQRCLEKDPANRFQSARDLAFQLQLIATSPRGAISAATPRWRLELGPRTMMLAGIALLLVVAAVALLAHRSGAREPPKFQQLTFRRGFVREARFAPDGQTVVYSALFGAEPEEMFSTRLSSTESRSLSLKGARLASISSSGEIAVIIDEKRTFQSYGDDLGTLAVTSLAGGGLRELLPNVRNADWASDGLAIIRSVGDRDQLEFPIGNVVYRSSIMLMHPRVSPKGDQIAFLDTGVGNTRSIRVADRKGRSREVVMLKQEVFGMAWSGDEIWFAASERGLTHADSVQAVTLSGNLRVLARGASNFSLRDVSTHGQALVTQGDDALRVVGRAPGEGRDRDLSGSWAFPLDLSADGRTLLFDDIGRAGRGTAYIRVMDGSPAVRLLAGSEFALSPDARWVAASSGTAPEISIVPTRAGEPRTLKLPVHEISLLRWFPDGRRLAVVALEHAAVGERAFVLDLEGRLSPITPPEVNLGYGRDQPISPDGNWMVLRRADGAHFLWPTDGQRQPRHLPSIPEADLAIAWTADGGSLFVREGSKLPQPVYLLDVESGRKRPWREFDVPDRSGVPGIQRILIAAKADAYVFSYQTRMSALYAVDGLR